ncbi:MAG: hypothetical protein KAS32_14605 [Candidatus Peribacteraceae bacterium]|nr:hypothetical protein [Candidatus Peribacteraceae bacterium]
MPINSHIQDPSNGLVAQVVNGEETNALVVASRPLKQFNNRVFYFFSETYGINMNLNVSFGGTPVKVHNGIDDALWTGSSIIGANWDFQDAAQNHTAAGTYSVSGTLLTQGDVAEFDKGSNLDLSGYTALTLWIYVSSGWNLLDIIDIVGWDTNANALIGDPVNLGDYINVGNTGVWQQAVIPLGDMDLVGKTIDALHIVYTLRNGTKTTTYFDDIQFEETGSPISFSVKPNPKTWLHALNMVVSVADVYDGTLTDGTMPKLPYNSILGVSELSSGIRWERIQDGKRVSTFVLRKLMDAMEFPSASLVNYGDDGTNTWFTLNFQFSEAIVLKSEDDDRLVITINDDLSGLLHLRMTLGCKEEDRSIIIGDNC